MAVTQQRGRDDRMVQMKNNKKSEADEMITENEVMTDDDDGDNKLDDEETEGNLEVEIIDYDGDKKSDELEETNAGGKVERKPWKSERVRKRASIMTYDQMGGNPRKTYC